MGSNLNNRHKVFFVSGIDTGIGKTYATGLLARDWRSKGIHTITQKLVQTGSEGVSEDIVQHRRLMGTGFTKEDSLGWTMPEIFRYPSSPHLAAALENRTINFEKIRQATENLSAVYDAVLIEGAGGLMVPLTRDYLIVDYIEQMQYPLILVSSGRLGSINHTLLSLELIKHRKITLHSLVYNAYPKTADAIIEKDTKAYLKRYLAQHFAQAAFLETEMIS